MCDKKQNRTRSWNGQSRNHCGRLIIISYTPKLTACVWAERGQVFCLLHNIFFVSDEMPVTKQITPTFGVWRDSEAGVTYQWGLESSECWVIDMSGVWDCETWRPGLLSKGPTCSSPWVLASSQMAASVQLDFLVAQGSKYSVQGNRAKTSSPFMT